MSTVRKWWHERQARRDAERQRQVAVCEAARNPSRCSQCGSRMDASGCDRCFDLMLAKEYR